MGAIPVIDQLPKFWYYEEASFFKGPWVDLDSTLSRSLNFLQSIDCRGLFEGLAIYNNQIMNSEGLAFKMKSIINQRHQNLEPTKEYLEQLRKVLKDEMDANQL